MIFNGLLTTSLFWSIVGQRVCLILILFLAMPLCMAQGEKKFCGQVVDVNGPKSAFNITDQPQWVEKMGAFGYEFKKDNGRICVGNQPASKNGKENYIVVVTPNGEPKKITSTSGCHEMGGCVSPPPPIPMKTKIAEILKNIQERSQAVGQGVTKSGLPPLPKMLVPSGDGIRLVQGKPTLHLFLGECKNCERKVGICEKVNTTEDCNKGKQGTSVNQNGIISLTLPSKLQESKTYSVGINNGETVVDLKVLGKSSLDNLPPTKSFQDVVSHGCKIAQLGITQGWNLEAYQQIVEKIKEVNDNPQLKIFSGILEKVKNALQYPDTYKLSELNSACAN